MSTCGLLNVFNIKLQTLVTSGDEIFKLTVVKYCRKAEKLCKPLIVGVMEWVVKSTFFFTRGK